MRAPLKLWARKITINKTRRRKRVKKKIKATEGVENKWPVKVGLFSVIKKEIEARRGRRAKL